MFHNFQSTDGSFRYQVDAFCDEPYIQSCSKNCHECKHCKISLDLKDFIELAKRADCYNLDKVLSSPSLKDDPEEVSCSCEFKHFCGKQFEGEECPICHTVVKERNTAYPH